MAASEGFSKAVRVWRPADFERVFAARWTAAAHGLVMHAAPSACEPPTARLGVSVSRRIGNAVVRNRWKRRLREAFRLVRPRLPTGRDYVIVVRSGLPPRGAAGAAEVEQAIVALAARVTGRPGYATAVPRPADGRRRGRGRKA